MRFLKTYLAMTCSLACLDWALLTSRFIAPGASMLAELSFRVVNFPLGSALLWLERKNNPSWFAMTGHRLPWLLNDEIGTGLALITMVLLQALLLTALLRFALNKGAATNGAGGV